MIDCPECKHSEWFKIMNIHDGAIGYGCQNCGNYVSADKMISMAEECRVKIRKIVERLRAEKLVDSIGNR